jgi:hypothetical protein
VLDEVEEVVLAAGVLDDESDEPLEEEPLDDEPDEDAAGAAADFESRESVR